MKGYLLLIFFSLIIEANISGQTKTLSPQEEAMQVYSSGNYAEALERFKKLATLFPKDPKYFYYIGVCMVQTNTTIKEAEKNLLYASEYAVPRDVYFYLGKTYHYQYKFADALDAYLKFKSFGNPADHDKFLINMHIAMARNGKGLRNYLKLNVLDKKPIEYTGLFPFYNLGLKNGQFKSKSQKTPDDKKILESTDWRYEPYLSEKDIIVFGTNQGLFKKNKEVYRTQKIKKDQWTRPEALPATINTPYDEDYAYFNEPENALYFASKGHNSMGGYDIFKSIYNPDYKTWSEPVNLGYPINSPYNDFLFVPSDDQKTAYFASDRETTGNKIIVYKIEFEKNFTYHNIPEGFVFKNVLPDTVAPKVIAQTLNNSVNKAVPLKSDSAIPASPIVYTPKNNINPGTLHNNHPYNQTINEALTYQLLSDSLTYIISEQRELLNNTANDSEKAKIRTKIFQLDKQVKLNQVKADSLYKKASLYENNSPKETTQSSTTINSELVKNSFTQNKKEEKNTAPAVTPSKVNKTKNTQVLYEFKVMAQSPYKSISEIPVNQPLPDGVVYRVQMGAFSKTVEPDRFKGIIPISGETVGNTSVTKYYAGLFGRFADAEKALNKIKEYGFKDAFIVSFYNGKPIPANRAQEIEKSN